MNLSEYERVIQEIAACDLPSTAKDAALYLISSEIDQCLWNPWAMAEARRLSSLALSLMENEPCLEDLEGFDDLALADLLRLK